MSDIVKNISTDEYKELLKQEGYMLVDFWATWCPPCRVMAPIIDQLAPQMQQITFVKIDVDQHPEPSLDFNVMSIPTFVLMKRKGDGTYDIVKKLIGATSAFDFKQHLENGIKEYEDKK